MCVCVSFCTLCECDDIVYHLVALATRRKERRQCAETAASKQEDEGKEGTKEEKKLEQNEIKTTANEQTIGIHIIIILKRRTMNDQYVRALWIAVISFDLCWVTLAVIVLMAFKCSWHSKNECEKFQFGLAMCACVCVRWGEHIAYRWTERAAHSVRTTVF